MSAPIHLKATLRGGPADGAELRVEETCGFLLAAAGREVHGYEWGQERAGKRWVYRHTGLLARTGPGTRAAEVLWRRGGRVVEVAAEAMEKGGEG